MARYFDFKKPWVAIDSSKDHNNNEENTQQKMLAGRYLMEQVDNPYAHDTGPWLVVKGTPFGDDANSIMQKATEHTEPGPPNQKLEHFIAWLVESSSDD